MHNTSQIRNTSKHKHYKYIHEKASVNLSSRFSIRFFDLIKSYPKHFPFATCVLHRVLQDQNFIDLFILITVENRSSFPVNLVNQRNDLFD